MDRTILITGASSGVGRALTHYLSRRFRVIAASRRLPRMIEEFHAVPNVFAYGVNVADEAELEQFCDSMIEQYGPIQYVVNNAGVNVSGRGLDLTPEQIRFSYEVNAMGPFLIMKKLLPSMREAGFGRIINVTSGAPLNCFPGYSAYSSSKGALNAITVTIAREFADSNIKINLMSPGPVRTEMAPTAPMDPSVCFPTVDYLLGLDESGPTGKFFWLGHEIPLFPDLQGIQWLEGKADSRYRRVL